MRRSLKNLLTDHIEELLARRRKGLREVWLVSPVFAGVRRNPEQAARLAEMIRDYPGWDGLAADPARPLTRLP